MTYPETDKLDVEDTYHGRIVKDPYRWLEDTESADEPFFDAVLVCEFASAVLHAYLLGEIEVGSPSAFDKVGTVPRHGVAGLQQEGLQGGEVEVLLVDEGGHHGAVDQGEVPTNDNAVEARQGPGYAGAVLLDELVHGLSMPPAAGA